MRYTKIIFLILITTLITACASNLFVPESQRISTLLTKKNPQKKYYVIYVEAPSGFISKKLAIATLKAGNNSNNIDAIVNFLTSSKNTLVVTGNDDEFTSTTLIQAFNNLKGKTISTSSIVYVGELDYQKELLEAAKKVAISIEFAGNV